MIATETARTAVLGLFALSVIWIIVIIVKNDMQTIVRAIVVAAVLGLALLYVNQTELETLSFKAVKNELFPPKEERYTFEIKESVQGGFPTTVYAFSDPGPRLALHMEEGGKYLAVKDTDAINRVLARLGLPPVSHGVRELSSITGRTLDGDKYVWEDYALGRLIIIRGICRDMTTTGTFPCISTLSVQRR
ncbi:MAG: hypothetical protein FJY79_08030 [Candidatus Aminicenantes bacterium]|nr:hypothetical protein [Candidatus Aminicenantes bacterium]